MNASQPLAIHYRREAYQETLRVADVQRVGRPQGLMGREVASNNFLSAVLRYGTWSTLEAIVESASDRESLKASCQQELSSSATPRRVRITPMQEFASWMRGYRYPQEGTKKLAPPSQILHFASPPEPRFAWARQRYAPHTIAFSGVTHTLCSPLGLDVIWQLVTAPMFPYDRLISTSSAVTSMLKSTTDVMCEYLSMQTGGTASLGMTVQQLPLGVDEKHHRPATAQERVESRKRLEIPDDGDNVVLLFVGRLSHHAKAHPYPMLVAAQQSAESDPSKTIHLVLSGWFSNSKVREAFALCAARIAPSVRLHMVDGLDPWTRDHVWDAADVFISLADSIQETFGLTNLEAMSRGLPVVATDWNGYRDTVVDGETGYLIPTVMIRDATTDATARLITGEISYDQYLGEVGQTVAVSIPDAVAAVKRLCAEPDLRQRLGESGRQRVLKRYTWSSVISDYETMWQAQREQLVHFRQAGLQVVAEGVDLPVEGAEDRLPVQGQAVFPKDLAPARYPPVDTVFDSYPTAWLDDRMRVVTGETPPDTLTSTLNDTLLCYCAAGRLNQPEALRGLLQFVGESPRTIGDITRQFQSSPQTPGHAVRAAVAWMMKYDLLRLEKKESESESQSGSSTAAPQLAFVTTCMGRLDDLKNTLPRLVAQPRAEVVVVDYSCPQGTGAWVQENFPQVRVVSVTGKTAFDRSDAKNSGVFASTAPWVCLIDGDVELEPEFTDTVMATLKPGYFFRSSHPGEGTGGTFVVRREDFDRVGGHDPVFQGWGEEDDDLIDALQFAGLRTGRYPAALIRHRDHADDARTQFHEDSDRRHSHMINRIYRCGKWDMARLRGFVPPIERRRAIYKLVTQEVRKLIREGRPGKVRIDTGAMQWTPIDSHSVRYLEYNVTPAKKKVAGEYAPSHQPKG